MAAMMLDHIGICSSLSVHKGEYYGSRKKRDEQHFSGEVLGKRTRSAGQGDIVCCYYTAFGRTLVMRLTTRQRRWSSLMGSRDVDELRDSTTSRKLHFTGGAFKLQALYDNVVYDNILSWRLMIQAWVVPVTSGVTAPSTWSCRVTLKAILFSICLQFNIPNAIAKKYATWWKPNNDSFLWWNNRESTILQTSLYLTTYTLREQAPASAL